MLYAVNCFDTFKDIFNGIVYGVFAAFDCKTLVTHILKSDDLSFDLFLSKLFSRYILVLIVVGAVNAFVYAVV